MDQEDWDARREQSVDTCTLLYANSYGKRGVVKRETVVETVITWEEIWIDVKLRHIADSRVVPRET